MFRTFRWLSGLTILFLAAPTGANQLDIHGPPGSVSFGRSVAVLPNGNFVVTDPDGGGKSVGAVYLFDPSGDLISSFTGSTADDQVGSGGIAVLTNGHFVVASPYWDNDTAVDAGAVTWVNGVTGLSGVVSAASSLVGTNAWDYVGSNGVTALSSGHYVVLSTEWHNGAVSLAGAATWVNGSASHSAVVSESNSLVGTTLGDFRYAAVTPLSNGHYVVSIPYWDHGAMVDAGAVSWGNGNAGRSGEVSQANSVVGTHAEDFIGTVGGGSVGITELGNGHFVIASPDWDSEIASDVGAVTWVNGNTGMSGEVSAANSLVGATANDKVGLFGVTALINGHYVVRSPFWSNGAIQWAGAVTWANGETGLSGMVSEANSLVGTTVHDDVGRGGVTALSNGHYVVISPYWSNGAAVNAGAVTWANGSTGLSGEISMGNSLVGSNADDGVGSSGVTALSNGHYVVASPYWDRTIAVDAGAATWANGITGLSGEISIDNSLVGSHAQDRVGYDLDLRRSVTALSNGNYVVVSKLWRRGDISQAGAVTWSSGSVGLTGEVSTANSLVGTKMGDQVGYGGVTALSNGHYVVVSSSWSSGAISAAGAVTWGNGDGGQAGEISAENSVVGASNGDFIGNGGLIAYSNGQYGVYSTNWDNGTIANAGAVTLGRGFGGTVGPISASNSVLGAVSTDGWAMVHAYDETRDMLIVGQPQANLVSLFMGDLLFNNGFD